MTKALEKLSDITSEIKTYESLSELEITQIFLLRYLVFNVEQDSGVEDIDGKDKFSSHLMFKYKENIIAYARMFNQGIRYQDASAIGRVVVNKEFRGIGLGKELINTGTNHLFSQDNCQIRICGQAHLEKFYNDLGYKTVSKAPFLFEEIMHLDFELENLKNT